LTVSLLVLFALPVGGLCFIVYQLVKQQGRLLLRVDELERRAGVPQARPDGASIDGHRHAQHPGLPVGSAVPAFRLPDLTGRMVGSGDFDKQRLLLIHWSPQCGFCSSIAPELAKLQAEFEKRRVAVVLVSNGDVAANRRLMKEFALGFPVLLQSKSTRWEPFRSFGTPVAYLLDEQGRVARPLAVGAEAVPALAREITATVSGPRRLAGQKPLSESQILRDGLKAGTPAPRFKLPDIHGRTVSLEDYRGRSLLLVFTDPKCGPCDQLAAQLAHLDGKQTAGGAAILMVGRGDAEENRRKARQQGFSFPVLLQDRWKLSKEFGIFGTPVAFLIDEHGVIARTVAKGVDEILAVARAASLAGGDRRPCGPMV